MRKRISGRVRSGQENHRDVRSCLSHEIDQFRAGNRHRLVGDKTADIPLHNRGHSNVRPGGCDDSEVSFFQQTLKQEEVAGIVVHEQHEFAVTWHVLTYLLFDAPASWGDGSSWSATEVPTSLTIPIFSLKENKAGPGEEFFSLALSRKSKLLRLLNRPNLPAISFPRSLQPQWVRDA